MIVEIKRKRKDAVKEPAISVDKALQTLAEANAMRPRPRKPANCAGASIGDSGVTVSRPHTNLERRKAEPVRENYVPVWARRGLFKPGFTRGPQLRPGKFYTKARKDQ